MRRYSSRVVYWMLLSASLGMRGFTIGAVSIAVANSLAVHQYRGRLHAHHRD